MREARQFAHSIHEHQRFPRHMTSSVSPSSGYRQDAKGEVRAMSSMSLLNDEMLSIENELSGGGVYHHTVRSEEVRPVKLFKLGRTPSLDLCKRRILDPLGFLKDFHTRESGRV